MKALKIEVDHEALVYLCSVLLDVHLYSYETPQHRAIALETSVRLGPRIFRRVLTSPTPTSLVVSQHEAALLEYAITMHENNTLSEDRISRQLLGQIQPKLTPQLRIS